MPDSPANLDHLVVGPSGVFVIDSKQWTGQVHQSADELVWHDHIAWTGPWPLFGGRPRPWAGC
jgi:hypothetical protein